MSIHLIEGRAGNPRVQRLIAALRKVGAAVRFAVKLTANSPGIVAFALLAVLLDGLVLSDWDFFTKGGDYGVVWGALGGTGFAALYLWDAVRRLLAA